MTTIKAIFFDLDNTLIDFKGMKEQASRAAIKAMIKAGLRTNEDRAWRQLFRLFMVHGMEDQKIFDKFLKSTTGRVDIRILAAGVTAYRKEKNKVLKPYPNVKATLRKLKRRYTLAIVTDAPKFQAWSRLYDMGLEDYFDFVLTFDDTKKKKPNPAPFKKALRIANAKPEEVLMVGDSITRDVKTPKKLGMMTALAKYGQVWKDKSRIKPDHYLHDISDIIKIV